MSVVLVVRPGKRGIVYRPAVIMADISLYDSSETIVLIFHRRRLGANVVNVGLHHLEGPFSFF
jgi:hypothetical protein